MERAPFFARFGEIVLEEEPLSADSPYRACIQALCRTPLDAEVAAESASALQGALDDAAMGRLNRIFERTKSQRTSASDLFRHYAQVKADAVRMAQLLFVHNSVREGLASRIAGFEDLTHAVGVSIRRASSQNDAELGSAQARFYGALFLLQTAFDRLFVPRESIGRYDFESGKYTLSSGYNRCTEYLDLSAIREVEASRAERELCWNITTGWGEGIGQREWDLLNASYYDGKSALTGRPNLFATSYDELLERMLPQFAYSKVRLAQTLVDSFDPERRCRVLEIGAGSGAFAIDLLMACRSRRFPSGKIEYLGLEPSPFMIGNFRSNLERKLGRAEVPDSFQLRRGSLEQARQAVADLVSPDPQTRTVAVFCFSAHHIYPLSLQGFLSSPDVRRHLPEIYVLEGTERHGWTKMYYMWTDCEAPENFDNATAVGDRACETLWEEPSLPSPEYPQQVTNAWCRARVLR